MADLRYSQVRKNRDKLCKGDVEEEVEPQGLKPGFLAGTERVLPLQVLIS